MNARGDMMPKALNLTDMLWQKTEGNAADRARETASGKAAAKGTKGAKAASHRAQTAPAELFPAQAKADGSAKSSTHKSFHERVKESQARMGDKDHSFFKAPAKQDAPNANQGARDAARPEAREAHEARRAEGGKAQGPRSPDAPARMGKGRRAEARPEGAPEQDAAQGWTPGESRPIELENVKADSMADAACGEGMSDDGAGDPTDYDALQARLEELGIDADADQLRDPAFLAEMLWMIDAIPMVQPAVGEALPEAVGIDALAAVSADGSADVAPTAVLPAAVDAEALVVDADASEAPAAAPQAAEEFDWTAVTEPEREEIASLIRGKLGALAGSPEMQAGLSEAPASAGAAGAEVTMVRPGAQAPVREASFTRADLSLSDPDRLRVLQGSGLPAFTADTGVPDTDALTVDIDDEIPDTAESDLAFRTADLLADGDKDGNTGKDSLPDLMGRQGGQAANSEAPLREQHAASREAATPFHNAMEQVRASETRLAGAKAPEHVPHARTANEAEVLAQLARKLSALGGRGSEEIRIQLEPEHLGRVRIALERGEGGMNARIAVENDAVRQIVDSNLSALRQSLEDQGIKLQNLDVSVEHRHASLFNPDGSNAREFFRRPGNGAASQGTESGVEETGEAETGRRLGYNTMEYIA